ncbi:hypothetical protein JCM10213_005759 [Rhodosporidiobolus nylandii]
MAPKSASQTVKLPPTSDPEWRAFYAVENEKLKQSSPGSTGDWRRKRIQGLWRKLQLLTPFLHVHSVVEQKQHDSSNPDNQSAKTRSSLDASRDERKDEPAPFAGAGPSVQGDRNA